MVGVLEKWAYHRAADNADDNVAHYGSWAIRLLATRHPEIKAPWLAAGAKGVLRGIANEDTSVASRGAKNEARFTLMELGHKA